MADVQVTKTYNSQDVSLDVATQTLIPLKSRKTSGLLIPAFAIRRSGDLGIGDTKAVKEAISFCAKIRMGLLELLPINETSNDNSPYSPISSFALDPALLTIEPGSISGVPGLTLESMLDVLKQNDLKNISGDNINYKAVKSLKHELMAVAFKNFTETELNKSHLAGNFIDFENKNKAWLKDYSMFRELMRIHNEDPRWQYWCSEELHSPQTAEKWIDLQPDREEIYFNIRLNSFVQWVADRQWTEVRDFANANKVRLMGDIPYGINRYSSDIWSRPKLFDMSWSIGAPPENSFKGDPFVERFGQNWGGPLYVWSAHEAEDFAWWKGRVQQVCKYFDEFRIDHVLGFFRVYAFPWTGERNHEFVNLSDQEVLEKAKAMPRFFPFPDDNEFNMHHNMQNGKKILQVIQQAAGETEIVAEDLGADIPAYVRMVLSDLEISGFSLFPMFKKENSQEYMTANEIPELSLATFGTHDHMPIKQFYTNLVENWHGPDGHQAWLEVQRLMRAIGWDDNNPPGKFNQYMHERLLTLLLDSASRKVVINFPDLIANEVRWNDPAGGQEGNWSSRMEEDFKVLYHDRKYEKLFAFIEDLICKTGRASV